MAGCKEDNI